MPVDILLWVLGAVVVGSALAMVISRNAIYAALFLVLNFATVALFYLVLGAPFISLVQVTVYAGSIMVLFLFVIMLLGAERLAGKEPLAHQRPLAIVLGLIFLGEMALVVFSRGWLFQGLAVGAAEIGSPAAMGRALFTQYALPFEVTGVILLVAAVGAILLTRGDAPPRPQPGNTPEK